MTNYRVHGITDETDTCEMCGKVELRRVVMLAALDSDGNTEEIVYAGTTCAARAVTKSGKRVTASRVRDAAETAARVMSEAKSFATEFAGISLNAYISVNHVGLMNAAGGDVTCALELAKSHHAELQAELQIIESGSLVGTRFEGRLSVI